MVRVRCRVGKPVCTISSLINPYPNFRRRARDGVGANQRLSPDTFVVLPQHKHAEVDGCTPSPLAIEELYLESSVQKPTELVEAVVYIDGLVESQYSLVAGGLLEVECKLGE